MLKHRLIAGTVLAAAMGGVLVADARLLPFAPCLFGCALLIGVLATRELLALLPADARPPAGVCVPGVVAVLAANWYHPVVTALDLPAEVVPRTADPWHPVLWAYAGATGAALLLQMAVYREPGGSVTKVAHAVFAAGYLGLLPSFFLQLRWLDPAWSGLALAAAVFVPKCGDIGAYFVGRFLGRRPFSPLLSPKKTWEGFAGGLAASVLTAVGIHFLGPVFRHGLPEAVLFGLAVGLAGVLGDLAESLIKRDANTKDAARSSPGFGGLLDVIDSVLFAGLAAYLWLSR